MASVEHQVKVVLTEVKEMRSDLAKHFGTMETTMRAVAGQLSGDTEKLQTVWEEKLTKLEEALSTGNESSIGLSMDDLQIETEDIISSDAINDKMSSHLAFIKEQLFSILQFQKNDKEQYNRESKEVLQGLRSVQAQLTRTEEKIDCDRTQ
jgi:hypothetical protein